MYIAWACSVILIKFHRRVCPPPEYSILCWGSMNASQSEEWVGKRPMDWHLYNARPRPTSWPRKKINFCPNAWFPSTILNARKQFITAMLLGGKWMKILPWFKLKRALIGLTNIMPTIIIGKIEMEFPTMYIINNCMGIWKLFRNLCTFCKSYMTNLF